MNKPFNIQIATEFYLLHHGDISTIVKVTKYN